MAKLIRLLIALILVAVVWLGLWRFAGRRGEGAATDEPGRRDSARAIPVQTEPVRRATVRDTAGFSGSLMSAADYAVVPRVSGRLVELHVDIGDSVTNGQLIAVLDDEEHAAQLRQARAERAVAEANVHESVGALAMAERDLDRILRLHAKHVVSDAELDAAHSRHDAAFARHGVAVAQHEQRDAILAAARLRLARTRIHAGWRDDGAIRVIGERHADEGAFLAAGQPIVSILDVDRLVAVVHVVEHDYSRVSTGQTANVTADALPGITATGIVKRIAPRIDDRSRQARVEIVVDNPEGRLRPGMFVRAEIVFDIAENACVVPLAALANREGRAGVFLIETDSRTARFVPVVTGAGDREVIRIVEPPLSGRVVTVGRHLLADGSQVSVKGLE